jgi:hypothetical protein
VYAPFEADRCEELSKYIENVDPDLLNSKRLVVSTVVDIDSQIQANFETQKYV